MAWETLLDEDFATWLDGQSQEEQDEILASILLLRGRGPHLGRPYVDTVKGSQYKNMKELRVQIGGRPWRVLFAFDPKRSAVLLVGGDKTGDSRRYDTHIPIADKRFERHLGRLDRSLAKRE